MKELDNTNKAHQSLQAEFTALAQATDAFCLSKNASAEAVCEKEEDTLVSSKLYRNAEFVCRILETNQDCIKVLSLEGRLLYMNRSGQKIMEIDNFLSDVKGAPWLCFWKGETHQNAKAAFNAACRGEVGKFDGFCETAKGTPKWWEVVITPMRNSAGEITELLSVSRDITARKQAEIALQMRNQELDDFARIVSHDLKAPLRAVSSLSEWILEDMQQGLVPTETRNQLDMLRSRVLRMNALIDGLLEVARVGRQRVEPEPITLHQLLDELVDSLSPPQTFIIKRPDVDTTLMVRKVLLSQTIANLLSNALKHHDKAEGEISVTSKENAHQYEFVIADDGPGIPYEDRDRVFEMFQTLANDKSTINTGIGLALVKKIVEEEGGKLWLEENTPRGCKFCFIWPKVSKSDAALLRNFA